MVKSLWPRFLAHPVCVRLMKAISRIRWLPCTTDHVRFPWNWNKNRILLRIEVRINAAENEAAILQYLHTLLLNNVPINFLSFLCFSHMLQ